MGPWILLVSSVVPAAGQAELDDPNALRGQIIVRPGQPTWLKRNGGGSVFLCGPGDPEGFLYGGRRRTDGTRDGDQVALIRKLIEHGGNCIYMQIVRSHGGDGERDHNPFVDSDPSKGLSRPILDQWAGWFRLMDDGDICIYLFLYDDSARIWNTKDRVGPAERAFLEGIVNRFEGFRNLIWVVAEEYGERLSARRVSGIAAAIRAADDHNHVIAVHKNNGLSFAEFADDPAIEQFAIQWNVPTAKALHDGVVKAWRTAAGRYNLVMSEAQGHTNDVRRKNWACAMGGACVMVLGMDIASTPPGDLGHCRILQRFFEAIDLRGMAPHDELAFGRAQYVLARPGRSYVAYAADASGNMGLRDMKAGTYDFLWLDCVTGKRVERPGVEVPAGDRAWPRPKGIGKELAVCVRRRPEAPVRAVR